MKKTIFIFIFVLLAIPNSHAQPSRSGSNQTTITGYLNNGGVIYSGSPVLNIQPQSDNINYTANWSNGINMPNPTRYHGSGCMWVNPTKDTAKLFCIGGDVDGTGNTSDLVNIYNVTTNSWSLAPPVSEGRFYPFACCAGDSVHFFGGIGGTGGAFTQEVNTVDVYNVRTNTMTLGPVLPNTYADARALPYQDSIIYIVGGLVNGTSNATANVYLFNRRTATYRPATPLPAPRSGFAGVIVGDTIYVVCGGPSYGYGTNTLYIGAINSTNHAVIIWTTGTNYSGTSTQKFYAENWGCKGFITGIGCSSGWLRSTECYVYNTNTHSWQVQNSALRETCAYFSGSAPIGTAGITKWIVASGFSNPPPYSIPNVQIFTDSLCGTLVGIANNRNEIPVTFSLSQNYPNPFNPATKIKFSLPLIKGARGMDTKLIIYDLLGREVATLVNEKLQPGTYEVEWNASNYSSGVYFYKLTAGEFVETKKLVLIK